MPTEHLSQAPVRQESVKRRRLSDFVADQIREYIIDHHLQPGDRLPTEHELSERFGVSRVSVREATKALGFLGLLQASPRRGTTVGEISLRRITRYLELHPSLRTATAEQLIDARAVIEIGVLPHLMERMKQSEKIYQQLNDLVARFQGVHDLQSWITLDMNFHTLLVDLSGLTPLVMFHELLEVFFNRFRESIFEAELMPGIPSHSRPAIASHQRLIDLLRDQRLAEATDELRTHITSHQGRL